MFEQTLLERITAAEQQFSGYNKEYSFEQSILRHLTHMLNTRRGSSHSAPDYGLADITDLGRSFTEENIHSFAKDLEKTIGKYEPRLSTVAVKYIPRPDAPLLPAFSITANIETKYGKQSLQFETLLDANGVVSLRQEG